MDDSVSPGLRSRKVTNVSSTPELRRPTSPPLSATEVPVTPRTLSKSISERFAECIHGAGVIDVEKLRKLSWSGIPKEFRPLVWKVLIVSSTLKPKGPIHC